MSYSVTFYMILKTLGIIDILKMSCMHNVLKSIVISSFVAINIFCFWSHNVVLRDLLRPLKLPRGILIMTKKAINTLLKIQVSTLIKLSVWLLANYYICTINAPLVAYYDWAISGVSHPFISILTRKCTSKVRI